MNSGYEKLPLLESDDVILVKKYSRCQSLRRFTFSLLTLVGLTLLTFSLLPDRLFSRDLTGDVPAGLVNWAKFTTYAASQVNDRHFVWKALFDQEHQRFRVDAIRIKHSKDEDLLSRRVEVAKDLLKGKIVTASKDLKPEATPVTILFDAGGVYGVYARDGVPQCRHYVHDVELQAVNPLDGATEHGLTYTHKVVLTNHYTDLNLSMRHGQGDDNGDEDDSRKSLKAVKLARSEMWVDAFSNKPMAAEFEGEVEREGGKKYKFEVIHHFYKWINWVDESQLTPPKQFTGVCQEVGHSGHFAEDESMKDFSHFLQVFGFDQLMMH